MLFKIFLVFKLYRAPALLRLAKLKTPGAQLQSFIYHPWTFQLSLFTRLGETIWTKWPIKNHKIVNISKPEMTSSKQHFIIKYYVWKFHENRSRRFREICGTKTVRMKKIIIGKKKSNKNNKVFLFIIFYLYWKYIFRLQTRRTINMVVQLRIHVTKTSKICKYHLLVLAVYIPNVTRWLIILHARW